MTHDVRLAIVEGVAFDSSRLFRQPTHTPSWPSLDAIVSLLAESRDTLGVAALAVSGI